MLPLNLHNTRKAPVKQKQSSNLTPKPRALTRGICRFFSDLGCGSVTEFRLTNGRRVDVISLNSNGHFFITEIKTSVSDFRADAKWPEYIPFCDQFYFAVPENFPTQFLPNACGLIIADSYNAYIKREAPHCPLHSTRRQHQLKRFALTASARLQRLSDPRT